MDFSPAGRNGFCFHARNHALRTRWIFIAVVACGARHTRDDRNAQRQQHLRSRSDVDHLEGRSGAWPVSADGRSFVQQLDKVSAGTFSNQPVEGSDEAELKGLIDVGGQSLILHSVDEGSHVGRRGTGLKSERKRGRSMLLQHSTAIRPPDPAALGDRLRGAFNASTFGQWDPIEAATNGSKVLAAKTHLAGKALRSIAEVSSSKLYTGDFSGAFRAASNVLTDVQHENEVLDELTGPSGAVGVLFIFGLVVVAWITERVLAKCIDQEVREVEDGIQVPPKQNENRRFLFALNFARYLVAWHVVIEHFGLRGLRRHPGANNPWEAFVRWGILAAPFFFMLSGFCNSYSKLVGPEEQRDVEEDFFAAMTKRVRRWYPFFLIALTWCALRLASTDAEDWAHYVSNVMLIHKLIWRQPTFPYLIGDFWLCWLIPYLLTWAPMHSALSSKADVVWTVFAAAVGLTIPSAILEWYFIDFPLFNMLQLWPSFVFGQALAHWFVRQCLQEVPASPGAVLAERVWKLRHVTEIPIVVKFGVTLTILISASIMFSFSPYDLVPVFNKPVTPLVQKGFQLPLQGLFVVGLAAEIDPIARLFARRPLRYAEALTLMTFLFQAPVYYTIRDVTGTIGMSIGFTSSLIVFSLGAYFVLERPYRAWCRDRERGCSWESGKKI